MYFGDFRPYVPVAQRRRNAEKELEKLRKKGHPILPVVIEGRRIAKTFWGESWCQNLEAYADYANRLPRGKTYARNGSVVDLQLDGGEVRAFVSGSELYRVQVTVEPLPMARWRAICADCSGAVSSLVELLQGRFSTGVMERLCRQQAGLFPSPKELRFACSCPDSASLCKHIAAVLYGVGARLDDRPELLFRLRGVDEGELIAQAGAGMELKGSAPAPGRALADEGLDALFGIELSGPEADVPAATPKRGRPAAKAVSPVKAPGSPARAAPPPKKASPAKVPRSQAKAATPQKAPRARAKESTPTTNAPARAKGKAVVAAAPAGHGRTAAKPLTGREAAWAARPKR